LAAGSRRVSLEGVKGRKTVLVFHLQGTAPTAREINHAVRERFPSPDDVLVTSVVDLSIVPPVYWLSVSLVLNTAYATATAELPPNADPADYVVILPDWNGRVSREYGARDTGRAAVVVVVDEDSNVAVAYRGEHPVETVLKALESRASSVSGDSLESPEGAD
jgi:hypothetical protein